MAAEPPDLPSSRPIKGFPGGERQRFGIAQASIGQLLAGSKNTAGSGRVGYNQASFWH